MKTINRSSLFLQPNSFLPPWRHVRGESEWEENNGVFLRPQTDQFTHIDPRSNATVDTGLFITATNASGHIENFLLVGEISPPVCRISITSSSSALDNLQRQQLPFMFSGFSNRNCQPPLDFKSLLLHFPYESLKCLFRCWWFCLSAWPCVWEKTLSTLAMAEEDCWVQRRRLSREEKGRYYLALCTPVDHACDQYSGVFFYCHRK